MSTTATKPATKGLDEIFCPSCSEPVKKDAVICVKCGVQLKSTTASETKTKTTSVVLAVFLGFWTWLYTYKKDSWKFWVNMPLTILTIGIWGIVSWPWAVIDVAVRPSQWYEEYPNG